MDIKYLDIVKHLSELDVATAQAYAMTEAQLGIKIDGITDFILKFIYTEKLNNRDVTLTILSNTLMTNENTVRKKLKRLIDYNLVESCTCGCDKRLKKLIPTELTNKIMLIFVTCKLKTATDISPVFNKIFGETLNKFYKEHGVTEYESFKKNTQFINYIDTFLSTKNIYKNTHKKLG
jgi:hypothetical protein